jgi:hypothetical protein
LDGFATRLADLAAGATEGQLANAGLFYSVRSQLPASYQKLPPNVQRDLHIFLMTQHPGMTSAGVATIAKDNPQEVITDFVAASIHSLVGRLFAFKAVEDVFCIRENQPLLEENLWIFASPRYDGKSSEQLRSEAFDAIRRLRTSKTTAIQQFAVYGFFFDWIEAYIDAALFRSLFEMFASHDFEAVEGDLLGRFFEIYSQKVNRTKRKALGQYYTPQTVVEFVWHLALGLVKDRSAKDEIQVLDPSMGSGTFLTQGARLLAAERIPQFWERLTGFDISAQVLGIAYVNFYVSILSHLSRSEAGKVGDLRVYATDTLDPRNGKYLKEILPLVPDPDYKQFIEQRIKLSSEIKQRGQFTLVIGNPPYRNNSSMVLSQVASVFPRLLASSVAGARAQERNPRDDYAWFFAAADHYVRDRGLIAFIVSDSFAQNQSYRYFRSDLLRYYHVRHLLRLGEQVFQDVGPRISFVIVVLEKRASVLESPDEAEPHPYTDLRSLAVTVHKNLLGSEDDPRFSLMRKVVRGDAALPESEQHKPNKATGYSLYPATDVTQVVAVGSLPVFAKGATRIYNEKWPGLITAFDELLKEKDKTHLGKKMSSFFEISHRKGLSSSSLQPAIEAWGQEYSISTENLPRLELLATQIFHKHILYVEGKIKLTLDGAMPNTDRWYPPRKNATYIYYETALDIPRNANEGKSVGWGSMQQWREPESHQISPKLVYTSASKPKYGLKAFVLNDEWFVKIHGGTSQQYNYTGISYPGRTQRMDGLPNNLTEEGIEIVAGLTRRGLAAEDINFYIASIYNSSLAGEFLEQAGSGTTFAIKIPASEQMFGLAASLAKAGRRARDLTWLATILDSQESIPAQTLKSRFDQILLTEVGLTKATTSSKKFRAEDAYTIGPDVAKGINQTLADLQAEIDELTVDLYS